jgi:hypothetical protein
MAILFRGRGRGGRCVQRLGPCFDTFYGLPSQHQLIRLAPGGGFNNIGEDKPGGEPIAGLNGGGDMLEGCKAAGG